MKSLIVMLVAGISLLFFLQCKKNNPTTPTQQNDTTRLAKGRYIIRTKYVKCKADSVAFVLGLFSNFESLSFSTITKGDDLTWIKENENYIWNVQPVYQFTAFDPAKPPEDYGLIGYRIYKIHPDGVVHLFTMFRPSVNENGIGDESGLNQVLKLTGREELPNNLIGIGEPLIFPPGTNENTHPGHFDEYSHIFPLERTNNGYVTIENNRIEHVFHNWGGRWKLTTTNNWAEEDLCNSAQRPTLRPRSTSCQNETEGPTTFRRCYIDEFYFEKLD